MLFVGSQKPDKAGCWSLLPYTIPASV